jgi:hypothetical protein
MFNLIQINSSKFVTTNMCTCELLVATMMNILIMFKSTKTLLNIETVRLEKIKSIPSEGTHAQGTGGSIHMSRHRVLLEIADHSRCRTMFAVQSLEHPLRSRRSEEEEDVGRHQEKVSRREDAPQKPDRPHT